ncbi:hypothetical protein ACHAAC_17435 [Aeromicrobium sp. CF4.19]|uniref:hypothetical protein n=1 Tax=Aeromicrobium sp. CF4.19 TaxID=3373082 RepID=UPI003EE6F888
MFAHLEDAAIRVVEQRARTELKRQEQHRAWEAACADARVAFIEDFNRRRLEEQVAASAKAASLRRYAARLREQAQQPTPSAAGAAVREWADWADNEADRIDPLLYPVDLAYRVPEQIGAREIAPFMPRGMSAWSRPSP